MALDTGRKEASRVRADKWIRWLRALLWATWPLMFLGAVLAVYGSGTLVETGISLGVLALLLQVTLVLRIFGVKRLRDDMALHRQNYDL
jgi:hypothetical protein